MDNMQINTTSYGLINIEITEKEAIDLLLYKTRFGIEHTFSKTIPITLDIKTHVWEGILNWAKLKRSELLSSMTDEELEEAFEELPVAEFISIEIRIEE